jgi:hypothetical protein
MELAQIVDALEKLAADLHVSEGEYEGLEQEAIHDAACDISSAASTIRSLFISQLTVELPDEKMFGELPVEAVFTTYSRVGPLKKIDAEQAFDPLSGDKITIDPEQGCEPVTTDCKAWGLREDGHYGPCEKCVSCVARDLGMFRKWGRDE